MDGYWGKKSIVLPPWPNFEKSFLSFTLLRGGWVWFTTMYQVAQAGLNSVAEVSLEFGPSS